MLSTAERAIEESFSKHAPVERVKKIRDYAFVHFFSRDGAHQAMQAMNGWSCVAANHFILYWIPNRINPGRCSP